MKELVGRRIRELRAARGMTQEAVAEAAGIHPKYFGSIERGEVNLTLSSLEKIGAALMVTPDELLRSGDAPRRDDRRAVVDLARTIAKQGDDDRVSRLRWFLERIFR